MKVVLSKGSEIVTILIQGGNIQIQTVEDASNTRMKPRTVTLPDPSNHNFDSQVNEYIRNGFSVDLDQRDWVTAFAFNAEIPQLGSLYEAIAVLGFTFNTNDHNVILRHYLTFQSIRLDLDVALCGCYINLNFSNSAASADDVNRAAMVILLKHQIGMAMELKIISKNTLLLDTNAFLKERRNLLSPSIVTLLEERGLIPAVIDLTNMPKRSNMAIGF